MTSTLSDTRSVPLEASESTLSVRWTTIAAPSTAPHGLPMPPMSGMKTARKMTLTLNVSGFTAPTYVVKSAPPSEAIAAPAPSATRLSTETETPAVSTAIGTSREARMTTPHGLRRSRSRASARTPVSTTAISTVCCGEGSQPPKVSRGRPTMPLGPPAEPGAR
nr:hypothetical protein [Pimelobacter simplex]